MKKYISALLLSTCLITGCNPASSPTSTSKSATSSGVSEKLLHSDNNELSFSQNSETTRLIYALLSPEKDKLAYITENLKDGKRLESWYIKDLKSQKTTKYSIAGQLAQRTTPFFWWKNNQSIVFAVTNIPEKQMDIIYEIDASQSEAKKLHEARAFLSIEKKNNSLFFNTSENPSSIQKLPLDTLQVTTALNVPLDFYSSFNFYPSSADNTYLLSLFKGQKKGEFPQPEFVVSTSPPIPFQDHYTVQNGQTKIIEGLKDTFSPALFDTNNSFNVFLKGSGFSPDGSKIGYSENSKIKIIDVNEHEVLQEKEGSRGIWLTNQRYLIDSSHQDEGQTVYDIYDLEDENFSKSIKMAPELIHTFMAYLKEPQQLLIVMRSSGSSFTHELFLYDLSQNNPQLEKIKSFKQGGIHLWVNAERTNLVVANFAIQFSPQNSSAGKPEIPAIFQWNPALKQLENIDLTSSPL